MPRARRSVFAAPLVVVLAAAGCGRKAEPSGAAGGGSAVIHANPPPLPPSPPAIDAGAIDAGAPVARPRHRRWVVVRRGTACLAEEDVCHFDGGTGQPAPPCNPPPPIKLATCPPPDATAIVERTTGACVAVQEPALGPVGAAVPCPP